MPLKIPAGRPSFPAPQTESLEEGRFRNCGVVNCFIHSLCVVSGKKCPSLRLYQGLGEFSLSSGAPSLGFFAGNQGWDFRAVLEGAQFPLSGEQAVPAAGLGTADG